MCSKLQESLGARFYKHTIFATVGFSPHLLESLIFFSFVFFALFVCLQWKLSGLGKPLIRVLQLAKVLGFLLARQMLASGKRLLEGGT